MICMPRRAPALWVFFFLLVIGGVHDDYCRLPAWRWPVVLGAHPESCRSGWAWEQGRESPWGGSFLPTDHGQVNRW